MFERGCLGVVTLCVALLLLSLVRFSNELTKATILIKQDAHQEALRIDSSMQDVTKDAIIASGTLTATEKASRKWSKEQDQLAQNALTATLTLNSDLESLGQFLSTGTSLVKSVQQSSEYLSSTGGSSLTKMGDSVASLATQVQPILNNASTASQSAANAIVEASPHLVATTQHADTVSGNAAKLSTYYTDKIINPHRTPWEKFEASVRVAGLVIRAYLSVP